MSIRKITEYPEAVLGEIGKPVEKFDDELAALCEDMYETMYDAEGVGLAAPQIGLNLRLFVMDCDGIKLIAATPEIIADEGETARAGRERRMVRIRSGRLRGALLHARNRPLRRQAVHRSPAENAARDDHQSLQKRKALEVIVRKIGKRAAGVTFGGALFFRTAGLFN
jgi:peptide deformylase